MSVRAHLLWALAAGVLATGVTATSGCGPRPPTNSTPEALTIERLRATAEAAPNSAAAWQALAMAEMWMAGGDAERQRPTLDHALRLAPTDPRLLLLSALDHEQRGHFPEALEADLAAIDAARASTDPLAPAVAELALAFAPAFADDVPDARPRLRAMAERVLEAPGRLGEPARNAAGRYLIGVAYRAGDRARAERTSEALGCLDGFRVAGPFGPQVLLGFDRPTAAVGRGPLAARYDLGPGRGEAATRDAEQHACTVWPGIGGRHRVGGTFVAEASLTVSEGGTHQVRVDSVDSWILRIDGAEVGRVDSRARLSARQAYELVELSAGEHEVELSITTREPSPSFGIAFTPVDGAFDPRAGVAYPEATAAFATALRGFIARARGDYLESREAFRLLEGPGATSAALIARADATLDDPFVPEGESRDGAKSLYERALARDPDAYYPALQLASMAPTDRERLLALRAVVQRHPIPSLRLRLADALDERGLTAEADAEIAAAKAAAPESCSVAAAKRNQLLARQRHLEAAALLDVLIGCNAQSAARFAVLLEARRFDEASVELERLRPLLEADTALRLDLRLAVAKGERERADAFRDALDARAPEPGAGTLRRIDGLWAAGRNAEAIAAIDAALDEEDAVAPGLRRLRRTLAGRDWLDDYRIDGAEMIREFEASENSYDAYGQVLVFDYMVTRVYPDGSAVDLIHQIMHIQSEESLERLGQLQLPGRILTLRSIKSDGRRLEPDRVQGLSSIPMTALAIGDYVEFEYVRERGPGIGGSYQSEGWVFKSFTQPFHLSQLVMVVPEATALVVDARGPVPPPEEHREDGLRTLTWTVHGSAPVAPEPLFAPRPEVLPRLAFAVGVDLDARIDALRDQLADRSPYDPAAARLVAEILEGVPARARTERARRLHRWVVENIENGGRLDGVAPMMLAARSGHRSRVLAYMLGIAGIRADLVLAQKSDGRAPGDVPELELFDGVMLRVEEAPGTHRFVFAEARFLPYDYVVAAFRGQPAIVLAEGNPRVRIPDSAAETDRVEIDIDIAVEEDEAVVSIVETHRGPSALFWRQELEGTPAADIERGFESAYAARLVPGGHLDALTFEGRDDHEAPFVLRYRLRASALGRSAQGKRYLPPFFASNLAGRFATLPRRTTTASVLGVHRRVRMRVRGPASPPEGPGARSFEGPSGARFVQRVRSTEEALLIERQIDLPRQLVTLEGYPAFAAFCREVDAAEAHEVAVPLR